MPKRYPAGQKARAAARGKGRPPKSATPVVDSPYAKQKPATTTVRGPKPPATGT